MEKIIQISINSVLFSLEEGAYNKLSAYINEIHLAFKDEQSGQEIIKDIEAGIAEHLKNSNKEAISINVVEEIISRMGTVSELTGKNISDKKTESKDIKSDAPETEKRKRLFRDEDHAILGGICSGIAAYLDVDVTWIRIAFIALIFLGFGSIIPIYIILWLIIPAAETVADKIEMKGNVVTLSSIANTVRDRVNEYSGKKCSDDDKDCYKENKIKTILKKIRDFVRKIFKIIGRIIAITVGIILCQIGLFMIIGFTAGETALLTHGGPDLFKDFVLQSGVGGYIILGAIAMSILVIVPSLLILIGGLTLIRKKPIFHIKYGFAIFGIWVISLIATVVIGTNFWMRYNEFRHERQQIEIMQTLEQNQIIIGSTTADQI